MTNLIRDTRPKTKRKARVRVLNITPHARSPLPPWPVVVLRALGLVLLAVFCILAWASCIAVVLLGPLWAVGGTLVAFLCFATFVACFSGRFDK